jgi:hypothetical protein
MKPMVAQNTTVGDAAVDGLLGGVAAGIAMAIYLVIVSGFGGEGWAVLARFDPNQTSPGMGALVHLAVSGVYGAVFGVVRSALRRLDVPPWFSGVLFGIALFALAETLVVPSRGVALAAIPVWHFTIAHIVYGLTLGIIVERNSKM